MSAQRGGYVIALLGAESTGKTTLAHALAGALRREGRDATVVTEALREFCDQRQRTPREDEQRDIAQAQTQRIAAAAARHEVVVADTSALMIAVYSDQVFGDTSLYADAEAAHADGCDLTLVTAIDLPWQPDGLQRDGPHVRGPVDTKVRQALARAGVAYGVVYGSGGDRLRAALDSVHRALAPAPPPADAPQRWTWHCARCGDTDDGNARCLPTWPAAPA
ncbi:MAG: ATP-binding protein [Pseudomonadota bacterium]|nr:ATP-binding protein [Pseudomonadota bacterium]